ARVPIYVAEHVMEQAAITPDPEIVEEGLTPVEEGEDEEDLEDLEAYRDFIEDLDLDFLDDQEG
ncbi:MAG: hypothetical protein H5T59_07885, partial [Anaerolineae bacterium]|nr:hypothetical protein [Anaerolineae bacterium]